MREYDLTTVCKWIGNSPEIAARHYASSTDLNADFQRATGMPGGTQNQAQQKAQQSAASTYRHGATTKSADSNKTAENKPNGGSGQPMPTPVGTDEWAIQDLNL